MFVLISVGVYFHSTAAAVIIAITAGCVLWAIGSHAAPALWERVKSRLETIATIISVSLDIGRLATE